MADLDRVVDDGNLVFQRGIGHKRNVREEQKPVNALDFKYAHMGERLARAKTDFLVKNTLEEILGVDKTFHVHISLAVVHKLYRCVCRLYMVRFIDNLKACQIHVHSGSNFPDLEYTNEMINEALASDNPFSIVPSTDANGHGSVMASLAAGSSIENGSFIGAAPDCQIAVVKLKEAKPYLRDYYKIPPGVPCYSEADILQAIQYLQKYVLILTRPLVICLGIGTSYGDHTGAGLLGRYLDYVSTQKSRVTVIAGGNEGNAAHHYFGEISDSQTYHDVELRVGEDNKGFIMDLWGDAPYFYNAAIVTPGGERARWNNPRNYIPQEFTFVYEKTRIVVEYQLVETLSGAEIIRFRFSDPTQGVWSIRINSEGNTVGGQFHIWLPITDFLWSETYFLEPNPYTTITEPAYVHSVVTAAAYQITNDSIAASSGRGYARDNYIVPDIAAPGVNVSTPFGDRSGASVAAAITAGGCAQLMEWAVVDSNDILVNSVNIKNYLIRGAERDSFMEFPDREWGYGRLDVAGVFEFLAGIGRGV